MTRDRTHVTRDTRGGHLRVDQRHGRRAVCRHVRQAAPPLGQLQQEVVLRGRVLRTSQFISFVMCKCVQMSYNGDAKTCTGLLEQSTTSLAVSVEVLLLSEQLGAPDQRPPPGGLRAQPRHLAPRHQPAPHQRGQRGVAPPQPRGYLYTTNM